MTPLHADGTKLDGTTDGEPTGGVWKTHVQKHARVCAPQAPEYANVAQTRPNVPGGPRLPCALPTHRESRRKAKVTAKSKRGAWGEADTTQQHESIFHSCGTAHP